MTISERLVAAGLPPLPRSAWLEIDLDALRGNVAVFRELIGPDVELSVVVKADAYGHGLIPVARAVERAGVDRLCVASIDEAVALRQAGIKSDILVLYPVPPDAIREAARDAVQLTVLDPGTLAGHLQHDATDLLTVEVEVESGLTRGGVKADDLPGTIASTRESPGVRGPTSVWTHLASPEDEKATQSQVAEFERAIEIARGAGEFTRIKRHMAATGGLLSGRSPLYEGVRVGLGLYGLAPDDLPIPNNMKTLVDRLKPAMALKCMPLRVESFPAGTAVGYGGTWVAQRESVIATLPVGYGDGFDRAYSPGAQALVRGRRVPLVGTVAMDAVMADVTDIAGVNLDDEFVLLGTQGAESITANDLARLRNTIPWEVVTSMSFRLPRVYHAGSVLMGLRTLAGDLTATGTATGEA